MLEFRAMMICRKEMVRSVYLVPLVVIEHWIKKQYEESKWCICVCPWILSFEPVQTVECLLSVTVCIWFDAI